MSVPVACCNFVLKPSKILLGLIIIIYTSAVLSIIIFLNTDIKLKLFITIIIIGDFCWSIKKNYNYKSRLINYSSIDLKKPIICLSRFVLIFVSKKPVLIFTDSMFKHDFRRLRIYLLNRSATV